MDRTEGQVALVYQEKVGNVKVVISSLGRTLEDKVDDHFGRAMFFVLADTESGLVEAFDNSVNRGAMQGAGIASAEFVSDHGAEAVITGHLGPKAFSALSVIDVPGYNGTGLTVLEAFERFKQGGLEQLTEAGEAHAG